MVTNFFLRRIQKRINSRNTSLTKGKSITHILTVFFLILVLSTSCSIGQDINTESPEIENTRVAKKSTTQESPKTETTPAAENPTIPDCPKTLSKSIYKLDTVHDFQRQYPPAFDWRNVGGCTYVTRVENQYADDRGEKVECNSCTVFALIAALESNARIHLELPVSCNDPIARQALDAQKIEFRDLSEAHIVSCSLPDCKHGWTLNEGLDSCQNPGVLLKSEFGWDYGTAVAKSIEMSTDESKDFKHRCCPKKGSKSYPIRISGYIRITIRPLMKMWISSIGPVVANMRFHTEHIAQWDGSKIYVGNYDSPASAHAVCIIGYDDIKKAWLCKNSLGKEWGDGGFFWVGYKTCGIDDLMYGIVGFIQIPVYDIISANDNDTARTEK
ncbi:MAG: C1 family peptidase [bacterium]|nr:C1 family peptidase [bacterium]